MSISVVAHRGDSEAARENTLEAFRRAVEADVDWIELDVRTTADGHSIVLHDATTLRLWGRPSEVARMTLEDVQKLGLPGCRIPTLAESLQTVTMANAELGRGVGVLVDTVDPADALVALGTVQSNAHELHVRWCGATAAMLAIREADEGAVVAYNHPGGTLDADLLNRLRPDSINVEWVLATAELAETVHGMCRSLAVWTVDDAEAMAWLVQIGVDAITTNRPRLLRELLRHDISPLSNSSWCGYRVTHAPEGCESRPPPSKGSGAGAWMSAMKKLINAVDDIVNDSLRGFGLAHPDHIRVDAQNRVVLRADAPRQGKVGLVSGGGSGHEPMHSGFVGVGMLDAACAGQVFTSPTPDQMLAATTAVDGGAGVLHIVKNYTGDVMNFEMAAELAAEAGIEVESVVVDDDVAVTDSLYTAGRRGVGLTVLLEKIVGAAAEEGRDLATCAGLARTVIAQGRSMGMALTSCTVPAAGRPTVDLADDEMEVGIGIHGEPGRERRPIASAKEVAAMLVQPILTDLDFTDAPVIVMLNGMGGTPLLELYIMYAEVADLLRAKGVEVARCLVGNYITSLEMAGCSLTLLKADDDLLTLWDAPANTPGLRWGC